MASVKIIHYTHKQNSDGTSPIILQVIQKKAIKRKVIANILPEQWNNKEKRVNKKHANFAVINKRLSDEFNRVESIVLAGPFDINKIFAKETEVADPHTFKEVADKWLDYLKAKNYGTYMAFSVRITKFNDFINNPALLPADITVDMLNKYMVHLSSIGNKASTIVGSVSAIRMAIAYGKKTKLCGLNDDLLAFKLPSATKPQKTKLTKAEIELFKGAPVDGKPKRAEIKDIFLLSVYLRGIRIGDMIQLKQKDIVKGWVYYRSDKNNVDFKIKLIPAAVEIVDKYLDGKKYLFTFFSFEYDKSISAVENERLRTFHIKSITANINGKLKAIAESVGIKKNISTHIARHTFGKMAIDAISDVNIRMDLMGHSSVSAHETYVRELSRDEELDDAADAIFGEKK